MSLPNHWMQHTCCSLSVSVWERVIGSPRESLHVSVRPCASLSVFRFFEISAFPVCGWRILKDRMKIHSCGVNAVQTLLRLPKQKWEFYLGPDAVDQPERLQTYRFPLAHACRWWRCYCGGLYNWETFMDFIKGFYLRNGLFFLLCTTYLVLLACELFIHKLILSCHFEHSFSSKYAQKSVDVTAQLHFS